MPDFRDQKDSEGKTYVWADPGFAVTFQIQKAYTQVGAVLPPGELQSMIGLQNQLVEPYYKSLGIHDPALTGSKQTGDYHGFNETDNRLYARNREVCSSQYLEDGDLDKGKALLGEVKKAFLRNADLVPKGPKYDKIREFYRVQAFSSDPAEGNLMEAYGRNPYLGRLCDLAGTGPRFDQMGYDACIEGLNGQTDSKGQPQPVFDIVMDMINAFEPELRVEYHRQKMAKEGWDDRTEARYLSELKAAHEQTLAKFDKMWKIDDNGQYDDFLNNEFDHTLGKKKGGVERDITGTMGNIRGELKAIENGWASDELQVLGFVGQLDAIIERKKIREKDDPAALKNLEGLERDMRALKADIWDKKVGGPEDKLDIVDKVKKFRDAHLDHPLVRDLLDRSANPLNSSEVYEVSMEAAVNSANKELTEAGKLKNMDAKAIASLDDDTVKNSMALVDLKLKVATIADEAKDKLAALEKMTKKGHKDGSEYIAMHDALKAVSELNPSNTSLDRLDQVLGTLESASRTYETTHTGWFKAGRGYGGDRLNMSKRLQVMVGNARSAIAESSEGIDRTKTIGNMDDEARAGFRRIDKEMKVRQTSAADLAKKIGADDGKQKEDFTKKRQEIEQAKPGFKLGSVNGQPIQDHAPQT